MFEHISRMFKHISRMFEHTSRMLKHESGMFDSKQQLSGWLSQTFNKFSRFARLGIDKVNFIYALAA
jgi:hypothetical protein